MQKEPAIPIIESRLALPHTARRPYLTSIYRLGGNPSTYNRDWETCFPNMHIYLIVKI